MIKKTFLKKGINYAADLAISNIRDLFTILKWNFKNKILFFRISSDIFPWSSHYNIEEMPNYIEIKNLLFDIGLFAKQNNIRLSFHPGPFNVLVSPNPLVVERTLKDLSTHGYIFDMLGLERSPYNKINIHCNGVYGDKKSAMNRFCINFNKLPASVKSRLTIENDDKESMYSVRDLLYIHEKIGIPIVFDYHHHKFCTGNMSEREALELAVSTWPKKIIPVAHYSESKSSHENNTKIKPQAHSDYINSIPNNYGNEIDLMVEAKSKELSILPFI
tara:strand:- start:2085 stop:2909 length:825 start_codon:yes stop_codon:yes gene_type:complete